MPRSYFIALVVVVLAFVWMASGYIGTFTTPHAESSEPRLEAEEEAKPLPRVRVALSQAQANSRQLTVQGRTEAQSNVYISAQIDGRVQEVMFDRGDQVEAGTVIAKIDEEDRRNLVHKNEAVLAQRQLEFNAANRLNQSGFQSQVRLAQAQADLETARAELERARIDLAQTDITVPTDGMIIQRMIEPGSYVARGNQLFQVADLDPLKIIASVPENQINYVKLGQDAEIRIPGLKTIAGTVSFIAAQAEETTRTFEIEVEVPNPERTIRAGQTAAIVLAVDGERTHKIPGSVLTLDGQGTLGVKTLDARNHVVFNPIEIVDDDPEGVWALGLPPQVQIITVGQEFVLEGQEVEPVFDEAEDAQIGQSLN